MSHSRVSKRLRKKMFKEQSQTPFKPWNFKTVWGGNDCFALDTTKVLGGKDCFLELQPPPYKCDIDPKPIYECNGNKIYAGKHNQPDTISDSCLRTLPCQVDNPSSSSSDLGVKIGAGVAGSLLLLGMGIFCFFKRCRRRPRQEGYIPVPQPPQEGVSLNRVEGNENQLAYFRDGQDTGIRISYSPRANG